jgi:hypothetical protein
MHSRKVGRCHVACPCAKLIMSRAVSTVFFFFVYAVQAVL